MDIKKNQEYVVEIIDNGLKGEGITKIDGFTIFVPNGLKGEKVKIKILKVLSSHGFGKIEEVINMSKKRCTVDCSTYKKCGGCSLRHIKYEETLKIKQDIVKNTLLKQGLNYICVNDTIGMEKPYFYRNKLQYPFGLNEKNEPIMGVFAERTHTVIGTKECKIQNELIQDIANDVYKFVKENNISIYNESTLTGIIRHVVIRIGVKSNEVMITLVLNKDKLNCEEKFTEYITKKYPQVKTIIKNINNKNTNVILGNINETIYGDGYIYDNLLGFNFKISNMSFYQVNPVQTEKLYSKAIEYAELTGEETIFDLYCGIGTIGICASKKAKKLYGIETVKEAIIDAKENAKINNIENAEFFVGDVEEKLPKLLEERNITPDVVFVDPPRKGCDRTALETLLKLEPKKIVYISCNPATLARDLKILEEKYSVKEAIPVDMFPFTSHVEVISVLKLKR